MRALECKYLEEFPMMAPHDEGDDAALLTLLAKSKVWAYETEFRVIAEERRQAIHQDYTLYADDNFVQLPDIGALLSVIVGCQGDYYLVERLAEENDPRIAVKRAVRVRNRYVLTVE